jgi:molecular chaperone GrpE (heat shock protein)
MTPPLSPRLPKWPFFLGDALLLALAYLIYQQCSLVMTAWEALALTACVAAGAFISVTPFLLEYRAMSRWAEAERLQKAVLQIQNIEVIGRQIQSATAVWQAVQDDASKAVEASRQITESMTAEARAFQDFLTKANDTERQHLRLEVEKLHRAEKEWLQVLLRVLDHVYALYQSAVRAGQPGLTDHLAGFQKACRDIARRVGVVPFAARPDEPFDPQLHQLMQSGESPPVDAVVEETLATGYRYQGQVIRPALVTLRGAKPEPSDLSLSPIHRQRQQAPPSPTSVSSASLADTAAPAAFAASPAAEPDAPTGLEAPLATPNEEGTAGGARPSQPPPFPATPAPRTDGPVASPASGAE